MLDEIRLIVGDIVSSVNLHAGPELFRSALLFDSNEAFSSHLKERSSKIKSAITDIFSRLPSASPDVRELQERLAALLATEKAHIVESQRIIAERDQLTERLEQASYRYLMAEKKLDRSKSAAVQRLESQAIMGGNVSAAAAASADAQSSKMDGVTDTNGESDGPARAASDTARKEALAAAEKHRVHTEQLEIDNKRLTEELTSAKTRLASLSDDDYAKTDLYKLLKSQHDHVIRRINDLEATNVHLREEAQKLQAERTAYRIQLEEEARATQTELESQLARAESDLTRIRTTRDELNGEVALRKSQQDQHSLAADQAKELAEASQNRIAALESELERLRLRIGESTASEPSLDQSDPDALKSKLGTLQAQHALLEHELSSMEAAWGKAQALATKKVSDIASWEDQRTRLVGEKTKADQRYWQVTKAKESRESELRTLKAQNARSSEMVTQLKDSESTSRVLTANLEKQLSESKEALAALSQQNRSLQQKINEGNITLEGLKSEIASLKKLMGEKDSNAHATASAKRQAEVDLEQLKVRLEDTKQALETAKRQNSGRSNDSSDDWRVSTPALFALHLHTY